MRLYRVKYNFRAEDEGELSVAKDDLVRLSSSSNEETVKNDGWTLVETLTPPYAKGYVPTNYITKAEAPSTPGGGGRGKDAANKVMKVDPSANYRPRTAGSVASEKSVHSRYSSDGGERSPTKSSRMAPIRRLSDPRLPQHLLETLEYSDANMNENSQPKDGVQSPVPAPPPLPTSQGSSYMSPAHGRGQESNYALPLQNQVDLTRLFASHDEYFDQVMREREIEFSELQQNVTKVQKTMTNISDKYQDVISKIMSLEALVQSQREQLKRQIEQDNQTMNNRVTQLYS